MGQTIVREDGTVRRKACFWAAVAKGLQTVGVDATPAGISDQAEASGQALTRDFPLHGVPQRIGATRGLVMRIAHDNLPRSGAQPAHDNDVRALAVLAHAEHFPGLAQVDILALHVDSQRGVVDSALFTQGTAHGQLPLVVVLLENQHAVAVRLRRQVGFDGCAATP